MRIISRLNLGGPTYNASYLTKYLMPEFETRLLAGMKYEEEASSEFIATQIGVQPNYIPDMHRALNLSKDLLAYRSIKKEIREFKPDIVHTHAAKAGAIGRYAAAELGVPVICHTFHGHVFHSYFNPLKTKAFIAIERYLAKRSTAIIALSESQKEELGDKFKICPPEKLSVIPLGFDLAKFDSDMERKRNTFRSKFGLTKTDIAIGLVGRLVPIKNHLLLLQIIKELKTHTNLNIKSFIIGDGETRAQVESAAKQMGITYSTEHKQVPNSELFFTGWYREADEVNLGLDIVVLTSLNEGTPVSLIEAQASRKPIVATDVGGVRDTVLPDSSAFINSVEDLDGMVQNVVKLAQDVTLREEMGTKGYNFVKERFDYRRLVEDTRSLYNKLLGEL